MTQKAENTISWKREVCFFLAFFSSAVWAVVSVFTKAGASNVSSYVIGLIVFVIAFFVSWWLMPENRFRISEEEISGKKQRLLSAVTIFLFLIIVLCAFLQADVISGGQAAMEWGVNLYSITAFCIVGAVTAILYDKLRKKAAPSQKLLSFFWYFAVIAMLTLAAWWAYVPNSLSYTWDYEAYWFSAFAAYRGIPLSVSTTSYYGHYGMLLAPVFHLLGGFTPTRVAAVLSMEAVAMTAAMCYVLHCITKNFLWRMLGLFAMLDYFATLSSVEGQMSPHRVLFPALLCAFAVFYLKHKERHGKTFHFICLLTGYFIAVVGFIWCTDSGIVGIIAWCALHCYVSFTNKSFSFKILFRFLTPLIGGILSIIIAWQLTSVMNVIFWKGSPIDFDTFMMPISVANFSVAPQDTGNSVPAQNEAKEKTEKLEEKGGVQTTEKANTKKAGFIGSLQLDLARKWTPWGLLLLLFFFFLAKGLLDTAFFSKKPQFVWENGFGFFASVLGVFLLLYFFNRVYYYNIFTTHFFTVTLLVLGLNSMDSVDCGRKKTVCVTVKSALSVCLAVCLILIGSFSIGRWPIQAAKIAACQKSTVMSVFFNELSARVARYENVRIIGSSATYFNAALERSNEEIMWRPWVNEIHPAKYPTDATIIVADEMYWEILNKSVDFYSLVGETYSLEDSFTLNYNNVGYEESEKFYVYKPIAGNK